MFDANALFTNAASVTTDATATGLLIGPTPVGGVPIEVAATLVSGSGTPTLNVFVEESTTLSSGYTVVATFDPIVATSRVTRRVQSKKGYLRTRYTVSGTSPVFTVTAGVVSGVPVNEGSDMT
jgi:hypothetical protein